jgi:hypothetical protein
MDKPNLPKPCPFCGAMPDVRPALNFPTVFAVICSGLHQEDGCEIVPRTKWYIPADGVDGRTRAIAAWNKRDEKVLQLP